MSVSVNSVILAGNCVREPEVKYLANERAVGKCSIAINKSYKGKDGERHEEVLFVDFECWAKTAELLGKYVHKGDPILIEGALKSSEWETKDGQKRTKLLVTANNIQFLGAKKQEAAADAPAQPQRTQPEPLNSEVPF